MGTGTYYLAVAFINKGIRLTYEIIIFNDAAYIDEDYTETNYGSYEVEEKIKNALKKCIKKMWKGNIKRILLWKKIFLTERKNYGKN